MGYSKSEVVDALKNLSIAEGDTIFVHMSLRRLGEFDAPKPEVSSTLLKAFFEVIGDAGTLVVPTFNFGFCKGLTFDVQRTKSEAMGQFAEDIRTHPAALRSKHPFQSVAAIGSQANRLTNVSSRTAFSHGSSFENMISMNCKIVFFGVEFVETFIHVAEERANVDYRFWKTFHGTIVDNDHRQDTSIDFFARKLDIQPEPRIDNLFLARHLRENGILRTRELGAGLISVTSSNVMVPHITSKLERDSRFVLLK